MGYLETVRGVDRGRIWLIIMAIIPYFDQEVVGVIPGLRDIVPQVDPIYTTQLSWSERARLAVFIILPVLDGEVLELLFGTELKDVIADP